MGRRRPRQRRSRETLARILDAGAELLATEGVRGVTVCAIASRSGLSRGTIYRYFGSREELTRAVLREQADGLWRDCMERARALADLPLRDAAGEVLRLAAERQAQLGDLEPETPRGGGLRADDADRARRDAFAFLERMMEDRSDEIRVRSPAFAAELLVSGLGAIFREFRARRPEALRDPRFVREVVDLVTRYLLRDPD